MTKEGKQTSHKRSSTALLLVVVDKILEEAEVSFRFRVRDYVYKNDHGRFEYTRIYRDTAGTTTVDILTNDGIIRTIDGDTIELDSTWQSRYSNSVNSVIYFAFLPYRLNDQAVIKTYRGEVEIKGRMYHEVLVQFEEEGGGKDHDDNFLYWFDTETFSMDYFAYDYVTDGGGVRFREAYNKRTVDGLVIQDYVNYKPSADSIGLNGMRQAYIDKSLQELSRIELENVVVKRPGSGLAE